MIASSVLIASICQGCPGPLPLCDPGLGGDTVGSTAPGFLIPSEYWPCISIFLNDDISLLLDTRPNAGIEQGPVVLVGKRFGVSLVHSFQPGLVVRADAASPGGHVLLVISGGRPETLVEQQAALLLLLVIARADRSRGSRRGPGRLRIHLLCFRLPGSLFRRPLPGTISRFPLLLNRLIQFLLLFLNNLQNKLNLSL